MLVEVRVGLQQVVRAHDGGVAPGVPTPEPAFLHHRHAGDAVQLGEVVRRRETVAAAADDHDVVLGLRLRAAPRPRPPPVVAQRVPGETEDRVPHARRSWVRAAPTIHGIIRIASRIPRIGACLDSSACRRRCRGRIRRNSPLAAAFTWTVPGGGATARTSTSRAEPFRPCGAGVEGGRPAPATPRHPRPPLPLLPSGPDGVHDLAMRGDRCGPPSTGRCAAAATAANVVEGTTSPPAPRQARSGIGNSRQARKGPRKRGKSTA